MAESLGDLVARVLLDSTSFDNAIVKLRAGIDQVQKDGDKPLAFQQKLEAAGESMTRIGASLSVGVTAPIVAVGAAAVSAASDFQVAFNNIQAVSGYTEQDLGTLRAMAIQLGADTKFSANEAAAAMGNFASQGFTAKQTMDAMPGTLNLAAAGMVSVDVAADTTSKTLAQFSLDASEATRVADLLAAGAAASSTNIPEMSAALQYAGTIAHDAGMSLNETVTAITLMSAAGVRGEQAGTGLRGVISSLVDPSTKAAEKLSELSVATTDAAGKMLPLDQIMQQLKTSGATTADMFQIFGQNAATAASALMSKAGPAWQEMATQMNASEGAAKKMADTMNQGLAAAWEQMKGSLESVLIKLGEGLLPTLENLIAVGTRLINEWLLPAVEWFGSLDSSTQTLIISIAGFAAALGPVLLIAGQVATSITAINTALGAAGGLAGIMSMATPLIIAFGAAIAAWVLYKAITDLIAINAELDRLYALMGTGVRATQAQATEIAVLEAKLKEHNATLGAQKLVVDSTGKSIDEYIEALRKATDKVTPLTGGVEGLTVAIGDKVLAVQGANTELAAMKAQIIENERKTALYKQAQAELNKETVDVGTKHKSAKTEIEKFHDAIVLEKLRLYKQEQDALVKAIVQYEIDLKRGKGTTDEWISTMGEATAAINAQGAAITTISQVQMPQLLGDMQAAITHTQNYDAALKTLGVTSSAEYAKIAANAQLALDAVIGSAESTDIDVKTAIYKALQAQIKASEAAGIEIPADQKQLLADLKSELDTQVPKMEAPFTTLATNVSTVFTNFVQDIAKSLWDGDMSFGEKCKSMLKSLGETVTSAFLEPATAAIGNFIKGALADLLSGKGFGGVLDSIKGIGDAFGGIFGGGGGKPSVPGVPTQIPGGGAAGGIAGAAGGIMGAVGAIGGIASAISGIFGNFQMAGMNKTLDLIEKEVRYSQIHLSYILENTNDFFHRDWWTEYSLILDIKSDVHDVIAPGILWMAQKIDFIKQLAENDFKPALNLIAVNMIDLSGIASRSLLKITDCADRLYELCQWAGTQTERSITVNVSPSGLTTAEAARALGDQIARNITTQLGPR